MPIAGSLQQSWVKTESTFDTVSSWAATDAVDLIEMKIEQSLEQEERISHVGTLSLQDEIEGMRGGKWTGSSYVLPGAVGVAPDIGEILKHAFGVETVSGGVSVTYSFSDTLASSLQAMRRVGDNFVEQINGAWVEEIKFLIKGKESCKVEWSGGFASYGCMYQGATVSGVHAGSATAITLASGDATRIRPGVYVKFGSEDNGGAGYLVTAVAYATDIITVSPGLASGLSGGEAVAPVVPSQTLAGTAQGGIACGLSVDATTVAMISGTTTIKTGLKGLDQEATTNRASRVIRTGERRVEGELGFYYLSENTKYLGGAWNNTLRALIQRAGPDTAASRMKINNLSARLDVVPVELPQVEEATFTAKFKARQSAAAADECTVVFD